MSDPFTSARRQAPANAIVAIPPRPREARRSQALAPQTNTEPPRLSEYSTSAVPSSAWASLNFMVGAGMVIIQPSTNKIVVLYDTRLKYWFFPRGRKDQGESLEEAALREAYEESGYRAEFLPLYIPTCAPLPPDVEGSGLRLNTEPIFITMNPWPRNRRPGNGDGRTQPGEYLTMWYVGQIPMDAVYNEGTGMPDEQNFTSHLCTYDEAVKKVWGQERDVLRYAWDVYIRSLRLQEDMRAQHDTRPSTESRTSAHNLQTRRHSHPAVGGPPSDIH